MNAGLFESVDDLPHCIGDEVYLVGSGDLSGRVESITLHSDGSLTFHVAWFHEGQRMIEVFTAAQLENMERRRETGGRA